jgi:hypothetical protein
MINRREILKLGGGLMLTAPLSAVHLPIRLLVGSQIGQGAADLVVDTRFAAGRYFLDSARESANSVRPLTLDETAFLADLDKRWSAAQPRPLVGLTQSSLAVLVEALARKHRMVLCFKGWHAEDGRFGMHHVLYGEPGVVGRLKRDLTSARGQWGEALGRRMGELTRLSENLASETLTFAGRGQEERSTRLISWAFAPLVRNIAV